MATQKGAGLQGDASIRREAAVIVLSGNRFSPTWYDCLSLRLSRRFCSKRSLYLRAARSIFRRRMSTRAAVQARTLPFTVPALHLFARYARSSLLAFSARQSIRYKRRQYHTLTGISTDIVEISLPPSRSCFDLFSTIATIERASHPARPFKLRV